MFGGHVGGFSLFLSAVSLIMILLVLSLVAVAVVYTRRRARRQREEQDRMTQQLAEVGRAVGTVGEARRSADKPEQF